MNDVLRKYPRIPHLVVGHGVTEDDVVLTRSDLDALLAGPVIVEEKVDGANVSIRLDADGDGLVVASRGGPGASDRGGLLGRVRAWAAPQADELRTLLDGGRILFGEWVLVPHSITYAALPSPFIGLDVADSSGEFLTVADRDELLAAAGLEAPPHVASGTFDLAGIDDLIGSSAYGADHAEGVIVRADGPHRGAPRIAKRVAPGFTRRDDDTILR